MWITEGPGKADLAAGRIGMPVLGVAGVVNRIHFSDTVSEREEPMDKTTPMRRDNGSRMNRALTSGSERTSG